MSKAIKQVFKNTNFQLHETTEGYYLYDFELEMNIVMHAKNEQDAFIEALIYYQKTYKNLREKYRELDKKVENFVSQFKKEYDEE